MEQQTICLGYIGYRNSGPKGAWMAEPGRQLTPTFLDGGSEVLTFSEMVMTVELIKELELLTSRNRAKSR